MSDDRGFAEVWSDWWTWYFEQDGVLTVPTAEAPGGTVSDLEQAQESIARLVSKTKSKIGGNRDE